MKKIYDVAIIGLGIMGSASARALSHKGLSIIGFERFTPAHSHGSSHGKSRIIRRAYFEGQKYVPLVTRAYELWRDIEKESACRLFTNCGGLNIGTPNGRLISGAIQSATAYSIPYEVLDAASLMKRYPVFTIPESFMTVHEKDAGLLSPEMCVITTQEQAISRGARLEFSTAVTSWNADKDGGGCVVNTEHESYNVGSLVIAAGSWLPQIAPGLVPATIERRVCVWFEPRQNRSSFSSTNLPVYILHDDTGTDFYGFPNDGVAGVKVAFGRIGEPCHPDLINRNVTPQEIESIRAVVSRYMPDLCGKCTMTSTCLYTKMPDNDFVIDSHPAYPQVVIASPCSGHGFKFGPAVDEAVASLVVQEKYPIDISPFKIERFLR